MSSEKARPNAIVEDEIVVVSSGEDEIMVVPSSKDAIDSNGEATPRVRGKHAKGLRRLQKIIAGGARAAPVAIDSPKTNSQTTRNTKYAQGGSAHLGATGTYGVGLRKQLPEEKCGFRTQNARYIQELEDGRVLPLVATRNYGAGLRKQLPLEKCASRTQNAARLHHAEVGIQHLPTRTSFSEQTVGGQACTSRQVLNPNFCMV